MYQDYFQLTALPFTLTPNPQFFCQLKGHQEALNTLEFCIKSGEGFIKIVGEVGTGKTLLCRKILNRLDDQFVTAYIPNPDLSPYEMRKAFAREIGLDPNRWADQHELLTAVNHHLIHLHSIGKKVLLLVDEAQALSDEGLETVRLLTNLETESSKLLQVVLFGQPELNERLSQTHLRQLKQRVTFSYTLPVLNRQDMEMYLCHRLAVAGHTHGNLFTKRAQKLLFKASQGVPRLINILSHKALLVAYGKGLRQIDHAAMRLAIRDTEAAIQSSTSRLILTAKGLAAIGVGMLLYYMLRTM